MLFLSIGFRLSIVNLRSNAGLAGISGDQNHLFDHIETVDFARDLNNSNHMAFKICPG